MVFDVNLNVREIGPDDPVYKDNKYKSEIWYNINMSYPESEKSEESDDNANILSCLNSIYNFIIHKLYDAFLAISDEWIMTSTEYPALHDIHGNNSEILKSRGLVTNLTTKEIESTVANIFESPFICKEYKKDIFFPLTISTDKPYKPEQKSFPAYFHLNHIR